MDNAKQGDVTLIFPAVDQSALDYLTAAQHRVEKTICAASVKSDLLASVGAEVLHLPSIYAEDFSHHFLNLLQTYPVRRLYSPVSSVYDFMQRFIHTHQLQIEMVGQSPIRQQVQQHRQLMTRATRLLGFVELCAAGKQALSLIEVAGVLRQVSLIYGESNDDKLAALMGIAYTVVDGDVIEIGSLMGRSAFVLSYLAMKYNIGPLLTVDPWGREQAIQTDSTTSFQSLVDDWDFKVLSEGFYVNMVPFNRGQHAHLQLPSVTAFTEYANKRDFSSPSNAPVNFSGKISLIHIDGNHDFARVQEDCAHWLTLLKPGAWLILDDYIWAHGDGPYRIGNQLLVDRAKDIALSFVCGKALFVQFN